MEKYKILTKYRCKQILRNVRGFISSVVTPIYFLGIGLLLSLLIPTPNSDPIPLILTNDFYPMTNLPYANGTNSSIDSLLTYFSSSSIDSGVHSRSDLLDFNSALIHPDSAISSRSVFAGNSIELEQRRLLSRDHENEESDEIEFDEDIEVINLQKTYPIPNDASKIKLCSKTKKKEKVVVDGINFSVAVGQCYGLLGPNGAGKTTTLSMLTGSVYPTSGTTKIAGYDLSKERIKAFDKLGYCPQHDALFDELTPEEHLKLYAAMKDVDPATIQNRVDGFLNMMGIVEHKDKKAKNISGGTKRKLSFAISLVGEPTVAIMDEPSTGMDPASRHKMWEIVRQNVGDKASILTTHSMEEAEELCTNIGIMIKGKLECSGSPQELKERFGEGYQLDVKVPVAKVTEFKDFLGKLFNETELVTKKSLNLGRMAYKIPKNQIKLSELFGAFEGNKGILEIEDYSISQTTLEQVFISFAKRQDID